MPMSAAEKAIAADMGWNDILNGKTYGIANAEDGRNVRTAIYAEGLKSQKVVAEATEQAGLAKEYAESISEEAAQIDTNTSDIKGLKEDMEKISYPTLEEAKSYLDIS